MPRAEIASTQAMHTLRQLHAELAGKMQDNKAEARRLAHAIGQVEAVMKLLQPGYNLRPIAVRRRKPNAWFKRGTIYRLALEAMRKAGGPLTSRQIAERMLADKGITDAPQGAARDLAGSIQSSMRNHNGKTVEAHGEGMPARWKLIS